MSEGQLLAVDCGLYPAHIMSTCQNYRDTPLKSRQLATVYLALCEFNASIAVLKGVESL